MPIHHPTLLRKLRELQANAGLTRAELEARKLRRFRRLAAHACRRSPYYARIAREQGIDVARCVPGDFPVLTKQALMASFDEIAVDRRISRDAVTRFLAGSADPSDWMMDRFRVLHTSGSSGQLGYFVYSGKDWARGVAQQLRGGLQRWRPRPGAGRRRIAYFAATGGHFAGVTLAVGLRETALGGLLDVLPLEVNRPLAEVLPALDAFAPDQLLGYTGALKILAGRQLAGELHIRPTEVVTSGEGMTAADRRLLSDAFGCGVSSVYASSEHLVMGAMAGDAEHFVLHDDDLVYEIHEGRTLVTNLFNFTMPLIRYQMSDILAPLARPAAGPYLEVAGVIGRSELVPEFENSRGELDFISPFMVIEFFVPGLSGFQMRLLDRRRFRFDVCLDASLDAAGRERTLAATRARLEQILAQKSMRNVAFEVRVVDALPVDPSTRKFRLIVDGAA